MEDIELQAKKAEFSTTEDSSLKAEIGYKITNAYYLRYDTDECRKYGYETVDICHKYGFINTQIDTLFILGNTYMLQGENNKAVEIFKKTVDLAIQQGEAPRLAMAYHNLGASEYNIGNHYHGIECYKKALEYYDKFQSDDQKAILSHERKISTLYTNMGMIYSDMNMFNESLEWSNKALEITSQKTNPSIHINLGNCYLTKNNLSLALSYYQDALKFSIIENNHTLIAVCNIKIAQINIKNMDFEKAITILTEVFNHCHKYNIFIYLHQSAIYLGQVYSLQKNFEKAKIYFDKALELVEYAEYDTFLIDSYSNYSNFCFEIGNVEEAYKYLKKSYDIRKIIYKEELIKHTTFLTAQFESEQKKKELEIYRLKNVELVNSQKIIEQKIEELTNLHEKNENMFGMISHDLKNYIGASLTATDMLRIKNPDLFNNQLMKMVTDSNNKALTLVQDLLFMNKIDVDEFTLTKNDINKTIEDLIANLKLMAKKKNIDIFCDFYPNPIYCLINTDKFYRVIDNLCINAIKFTHVDGKINIKTLKIDNIAHIHISDTGIGMDEKIISKLFQQYSKSGRKGTAGEESTGLGLYIVKKIIEQHNGTVEVFSEIDKGSDFVVKIPCIE
ncbi:MAG: tetratricopeptide repeat-containing sensor histidine kinase [Candidatus Cloacimonetes bacterium]|nr:tetratricopeptide repeat-containing sensor histidine kinase [Candidatus Cloacimonadota bacterium]